MKLSQMLHGLDIGGVEEDYPYLKEIVKKYHELQSDGIVELANATFGGTYADHGRVLSGEYRAKANPLYLSSDGLLDASGAKYRDCTWFLKDMEHNHNSRQMYKLIYNICKSKTRVNVFEDERYPQFLKHIDETGELLILNDQPPADNAAGKDHTSVFSRFIVALLNLLKVYSQASFQNNNNRQHTNFAIKSCVLTLFFLLTSIKKQCIMFNKNN